MTIRLTKIIRHPIKAHGREALASVLLSEGACLPYDRHWAVAHDLSKFDPEHPSWTPCSSFQRAARTPAVMAIAAAFDEASGRLTLTHPALGEITFAPDDPDEAARFIAWVAPISPAERFRPVALVKAPGQGMTDSDWPSISINNLASNAAVGAHLGQDLSMFRWRGNLWIDGLEAFAEHALVGKEVRIGEAVLRVEETIGRCRATTVNPETGESDADTLAALRALIGEQTFGVTTRVIRGGRIAAGDQMEIL